MVWQWCALLIGDATGVDMLIGRCREISLDDLNNYLSQADKKGKNSIEYEWIAYTLAKQDQCASD